MKNIKFLDDIKFSIVLRIIAIILLNFGDFFTTI